MKKYSLILFVLSLQFFANLAYSEPQLSSHKEVATSSAKVVAQVISPVNISKASINTDQQNKNLSTSLSVEENDSNKSIIINFN